MLRSIAILLAASLSLWACRPAPPPKPPKPAPTQEELDAKFAATDIKITADEFNEIRPGMTHEQVVEIVGSEETHIDTRYNPGNPDNFTRPAMTMIYRWDNPDKSWCELEFIDAKLETKRHQDLKPGSAYTGSQWTLPETRHAMQKLGSKPAGK